MTNLLKSLIDKIVSIAMRWSRTKSHNVSPKGNVNSPTIVGDGNTYYASQQVVSSEHADFQRLADGGALNDFIKKGKYILAVNQLLGHEVPDLKEAVALGLMNEVVGGRYEPSEKGKRFLLWCESERKTGPASEYEAKNTPHTIGEIPPPPQE